MARTTDARRRGARRTGVVATTLAGVGALLSGCALGTAGGYVPEGQLAGDLEDTPSLEGASIAVGSKNFNENVILGKMAIILLRAAGADVADLTNVPGSAAARQAHLVGQIDAMWEYTGTGWITYLGESDPIPDEQEQYEAVRDADLEQNQLVWLPPAPMNNTYAFAMNPEVTERLGITSMSQLAEIPVEERTFCVESEFTNRPDGLPGMLETYGIPLGDPQGTPESNLRTYQTGAIYDATARGECNFGEVFTTDGRILALDLTVLEDDQQYFPKYNVSLVLREDVAEEYPEIEDLMAPVTEALTDEVLIELNARVDVDGEEPADVAYDWLVEQGFVS
ncbi:glycine betaine ABC transporter substrate-binding protein [Nocardioides sp. ChNu-153]|uniref:glycine betaine ABC transporter substrate-binding protein n=1 Tax=unclassified Nocardioides TaxID=2615069 RepID=UPI002405B234|nr:MULTISPECIES: glycine betaine ABC transporter substrate-binding protein [unclassified Nocardioides]MDF9715661.1 glycine betaine ABC transporter substrate-binding protein [Nocardioides sp. ChNu-99]MDN7121645.1 glycine betaine ABC transporter substrate-binding protein [Nocardioides sp. ChNu-153]